MLSLSASATSAVACLLLCAGFALVPPRAGGKSGMADAAAFLLGPLLAGLLGGFSLLLVAGRFDIAAAALLVLAAIGLVRVFRTVQMPPFAAVVRLACIVTPPLVLLGAIALFSPLSSWDSRSIWFFHAKIMAHLGGLVADPVWSMPAIRFSAVMHPKLLPAAGAIAPYLTGIWNEFVPKIGLMLLAVPILVGIVALSRGRLAGVPLMLGFVLIFTDQLANGMADGYFGAFAALAALFIARAIDGQDADDGVHGILCMGICWSLKSEGALLAASIGVAALAFRLTMSWRPNLGPRHAAAAALALAPTLLWAFVIRRWGVEGGVHLNFDADLLLRAAARLDAIPLVARFLLLESELWRFAAFAAAGVVVGGMYLRCVPRGVSFVAIVAVSYTAGLTVIYLGTAADLVWMLGVSAGRTIIPAALMCVGIVYLMLDACLADPPAHQYANSS